MRNISDGTLKNAYKPYDVVTDKEGNVGFIKETNTNDSQVDPKHQISYSVSWLVGKGHKSAWYSHEELTIHCNLFVKIAQASVCSSGNEHDIAILMSKGLGGSSYDTSE